LKLKTNSTKEIRTLINLASLITDEVTFQFDEEGMKFKGMDPSHVCLIDAKMTKDMFEEYDLKGSFTLATQNLMNVFKRAEGGDRVKIELAGTEEVIIHFENTYDKLYRLHTLGGTVGETPLPKLSPNTKIELTSKGWKKILEDLRILSSHINIKANQDQVEFLGKGDVGEGKATLVKGYADLLGLEVKEESEGKYALEYLINLSKYIQDEKITLEYSSKMPIKIHFKLSELGGSVDYYLAPRIES